MADSKILIDLEPGIREIRKEADGLENLFVDMRKSVSVTVKALEKGFRGLTASGRALNNTLYNLFGTAERSLASFDELDRLGKKESGGAAGGGATVSVTVEGVSVAVDAGKIVQQIQQTVSSTSGPMIDVDLAVNASSVTESVNDLALTLETSFDDLLKLDFSPLIGGLVNVMGAAGLLAGLLAGGLGAVLGDLLSPDFSPVINALLTATAAGGLLFAALGLVTLTVGYTVGKVLDFISGIVDAVAGVITYLAGTFAGAWAAVWEGIAGIFTAFFGMIGGILQNNLNSFIRFIQFLVEVFAAGWAALWQGIVDAFTTVVETIGGIIQGLITALTEITAFLAEVFVTAWTTVWQSVADTFTTIVETIGGIVQHLIEAITGIATFLAEVFAGIWTAVWPGAVDVFTVIVETIGGIVQSVIGLITEIISFLTEVFAGDWAKIWQGIVDTFTDIFGAVGGTVKGVINAVIDVINGMMSAVATGINTVIGAINRLSIRIPDWIPGVGGASIGFSIPTINAPRIPRLAMGAVIPPNREFMAVLGDQRHGNNIEAPEGLLRQIAREEAGSYEIVAELREILGAIREGKVMMVGEQTLATVVSRAMTNQSRARGAAVIPV